MCLCTSIRIPPHYTTLHHNHYPPMVVVRCIHPREQPLRVQIPVHIQASTFLSFVRQASEFGLPKEQAVVELCVCVRERESVCMCVRECVSECVSDIKYNLRVGVQSNVSVCVRVIPESCC
jgi:hypothetical protein